MAVHGWTEGSGRQLVDVLDDYPQADSFVVTEIGRDGMLTGPDLEGLEQVMAATAIPVIASGGIASLDDLKALAYLGVAGAITGKAVYEGRFTVAEALAAVARGR